MGCGETTEWKLNQPQSYGLCFVAAQSSPYSFQFLHTSVYSTRGTDIPSISRQSQLHPTHDQPYHHFTTKPVNCIIHCLTCDFHFIESSPWARSRGCTSDGELLCKLRGPYNCILLRRDSHSRFLLPIVARRLSELLQTIFKPCCLPHWVFAPLFHRHDAIQEATFLDDLPLCTWLRCLSQRQLLVPSQFGLDTRLLRALCPDSAQQR